MVRGGERKHKRNNTGDLTAADLSHLWKNEGLQLKDDEVKLVMKDCDTSGDGVIQPEEFFKAITQGSFCIEVSRYLGAGFDWEVEVVQCLKVPFELCSAPLSSVVVRSICIATRR